MPARLLYCYACEKDVPVKSERGLQQHRKICQKKSEKRKTDKSRLKRKLKKVYVRRSLSPQDVDHTVNLHQEEKDNLVNRQEAGEKSPGRVALFDRPLELPEGSKRNHAAPKRYKKFDYTKGAPLASHFAQLEAEDMNIEEPLPPPPTRGRFPLTTTSDQYGLTRVYPDAPNRGRDHVKKDVLVGPDQPEDPINPFDPSVYAPFENFTSYLMANWAYTGENNKSEKEVMRLVKHVVLDENFDREDMRNFSMRKANKLLDSVVVDDSDSDEETNDWRHTTVQLKLPTGDKTGEDKAPTVEIEGLHYRPLVRAIKDVVAQDETVPLHNNPYKEYWKPTEDSIPQRVYGELYSSDTLLEAHEELQNSSAPDDQYENVVFPLIFQSDATKLTNFSNKSSWPLYMFSGSQSKYARSQPNLKTGHQVAYIPSLPSNIHDLIFRVTGMIMTAEILTHLKRELLHAVLLILFLDPQFREAYQSGILISCADDIIRRFFPRILIYSADYPEKIMLALIKFLGEFPCPTCFIKKSDIHDMGTKKDRQRQKRKRQDTDNHRRVIEKARKMLFDGVKLSNRKLTRMLTGSLVPVRSAFSALDVDVHKILVPDILHEFEIGIWKRTFVHLIHILEAQGGPIVAELNKRYRLISTFGNAIRKFSDNASEMKKLAARDFEDLLQCALPTFEGLLPEPYNRTVLDFQFTLAEWHALAKLRLHTDTTLKFLEQATVILGRKARHFKKTVCAAYPGKEYNINTYKFHSASKYAEAIKRFGTTDSYSTHIGEVKHKEVKKLYARTNKRQAAGQMTKLERRQRVMQNIDDKISKAQQAQAQSNEEPSNSHAHRRPANTPYHISEKSRVSANVHQWIRNYSGDPSIEAFIPKLKKHIFRRYFSMEEDQENHRFDNHAGYMVIKDDTLHRHAQLRVNYTSYDTRLESDMIKPSLHPDIMIFRAHGLTKTGPYDFARVLGIFHLEASYLHNGNALARRRFDLLWIRRFQYEWEDPFIARRCPKITFSDSRDHKTFDFLDPVQVIRGLHLIPSFKDGQCEEFSGKEWRAFYINIFADRDMFMRFRGGGVGHTRTRHLDELLLSNTSEHDDERQPIEDGSESDESEGEDESESRGDSEGEGEDGGDSDEDEDNEEEGEGEDGKDSDVESDENVDKNVNEDNGEDDDEDGNRMYGYAPF